MNRDLVVFHVPVTIDLKVTVQDIDDIMDAALDYINYWCGAVHVLDGQSYLGDYASEQIARGGELVFEYQGGSSLSQNKFLNGLSRFYAEGFDEYNSLQPNGSIDTCNIDGPRADIIIQLALFNEVVYG